MSKRSIVALAGLVAFGLSQAASALTVGMVAPRGELEATTRWGAFGQYLSEQVGQPVQIVPLLVPKVMEAVQKGAVDVVLVNSVQAVIMDEKQAGKALATLNSVEEGSYFAGAIVVAKGSPIKKAEDLRGKKALALDPSAAAAYVFQAYYLKQKGIDVTKDMTVTQGKKQDDLLLAVKAGLADAAFVRSGVLEAMAKEGKVQMSEFTVLDAREDAGVSQLHTTPIYPSAYIYALTKVDPAVADKVKQAVLGLKDSHPAAKTGKIHGFAEPVALDGIKEALKGLKLPPYDK